MARGVRINRAKNFAGKNYLVETDLSSANITAVSLSGTSLTVSQGTGNSKSVDLSGLSTTPALLNGASVSSTTTATTLKITQSGGTSATADLTSLVKSGNAAISANNNSVSLKLNTDTETEKYLAVSTGGLTVNSITTAINAASSAASSAAVSAAVTSAATAANAALSAVVGYSSLPTGSKTVESRLTSLGSAIDDIVASGTIVSAGNGGIVVTSNANIYKVSNTLTLVSKATPDAGYAATYELQDGSGARIGAAINILKDQLLQSAYTVWGTSPDLNAQGQVPGKQASKTSTAIYPFLEFDVYASGGSVVDPVYVPVNDLFHDVTSGGGIIVSQTSAGNQVSVDTAWMNSRYQTSGKYISQFTGTNDYIPQITSNGSALKNGRAIVTTITSGGTSIPTEGAVYNAVSSATSNAIMSNTEFETGVSSASDGELEIDSASISLHPGGFYINAGHSESEGVDYTTSMEVTGSSITLDAGNAPLNLNGAPVNIGGNFGDGINISGEYVNIHGGDVTVKGKQLYLLSSATLEMSATAANSFCPVSVFDSGLIVNVVHSGAVIYPSIETSGGTQYIEADLGSSSTETWVVNYLIPAGSVSEE